MKFLEAVFSYFASASVVAAASSSNCKCTPRDTCWPSDKDWASLNKTLSGALIKGVPPASVCFPDQPNYGEEACAFVRSQWFNSTWHAVQPISIDYPIWANNSCNPIYPNGTSVTGDVNAGKKGCSIGNYAMYTVDATTPEQVAKSLEWAGKKNVRVVVKSTGHSYPGRSTGYGSLGIWTHNFRGIRYLPSFKPSHCPISSSLTAARVAAGETGIDVQTEMAKHNSIVVTGANPDVGIVGWLTGGGHGWLSSAYGMGADNLLEATIVTPSGDILITNPCQHSDLFFAIRGGGGGTYGVVTEVVVKAYPTPQATMHVFQLSTLSPNITSEYWDLVSFIHTEMPRLKKGGMQGYYFIVGPPTYPVYAFYWAMALYDKPNGTVEQLMAPIEERLRNQSHFFQYSSTVQRGDTYLDVFGSVENEAVANGGSAYGTWLMSPKSLADAKKTAEVFAKIGPSNDASKPNSPTSNPAILGHMIASPSPPSYYPTHISMTPAWRNTLTHLVVVEGWQDGVPQATIDSVYRDITTNKIQPLRELSPDTGAYFNECDSYEPEWQKAFWGENYGALLRVKRKVDPGNVLWCRRCVGSEGLREEGDGRLCRIGDYGKRTEDKGGSHAE
ncbi:FAD binding domain-containing protein [Lentithecium fluviatile CBS 122367]|uniref:FAD binding domain-containing protein n=1 Tax=Lentithecium fluviatile CBS 122367 TaxID=1168545 RepID=A0A6G1IP82_9PLEO|nr:FAD binding domain-containing protein [Lentithecium fluviatile CBS 122367]